MSEPASLSPSQSKFNGSDALTVFTRLVPIGIPVIWLYRRIWEIIHPHRRTWDVFHPMNVDLHARPTYGISALAQSAKLPLIIQLILNIAIFYSKILLNSEWVWYIELSRSKVDILWCVRLTPTCQRLTKWKAGGTQPGVASQTSSVSPPAGEEDQVRLPPVGRKQQVPLTSSSGAAAGTSHHQQWSSSRYVSPPSVKQQQVPLMLGPH